MALAGNAHSFIDLLTCGASRVQGLTARPVFSDEGRVQPKEMGKMNRSLALTALAALSVYLPALQAGTYYVDVEWTGPSNGTATEPFQTLAEAATAFAADGGTVYVAGGLYISASEGGQENFGTTGYDIGANDKSGTWRGGYAGWDGSGIAVGDFDWTEGARVYPDAWNVDDATMAVVDLTNANSRAFYFTQYDVNIDFEGFLFRNAKVTQGSYNGGALFGNGGYSASELRNCVFLNNETTGTGGGASLVGRYGTSRDCVFIGNRANHGGAFAVDGANGNHDLRDFVFSNNTATADGGALYSPQNTLNVYDSLFVDNEAGADGGAIGTGNSNGSRRFYRCVIRGNTAGGTGAAVDGSNYKGASLVFENCLITGNTANGGSGYVIYSTGVDSGGDLLMRYCTLAGNTAAGGGVYSDRGGTRQASLTVQNSILVGSGAGTGVRGDPDSTVTVEYNDVYDFATLYAGSASAGTGSLSVDPQFYGGGDYGLGETSDARNAATDVGIAEDLLGNARPFSEKDFGLDMGCYEMEPPPSGSVVIIE